MYGRTAGKQSIGELLCFIEETKKGERLRCWTNVDVRRPLALHHVCQAGLNQRPQSPLLWPKHILDFLQSGLLRTAGVKRPLAGHCIDGAAYRIRRSAATSAHSVSGVRDRFLQQPLDILVHHSLRVYVEML